jgi:hypothetical protein
MKKPRIIWLCKKPRIWFTTEINEIIIELTKHKTIEIQFYFSRDFDYIRFSFWLEFRRNMDHPGFAFGLHFFPLGISIDFHDNRHLEDFEVK